MQTQNRFFDDLARLASGAFGAVSGMKSEMEARLKDQLERALSGMNLVRREEFEAVKAMAAKARSDQEDLERRLGEVEARLTARSGRGRAARKGKAKGAAGAGESGDA